MNVGMDYDGPEHDKVLAGQKKPVLLRPVTKKGAKKEISSSPEDLGVDLGYTQRRTPKKTIGIGW